MVQKALRIRLKLWMVIFQNFWEGRAELVVVFWLFEGLVVEILDN